ncbi:MAG TPA: DUF2939 domain-containing protein [Longimicrobium sp.]|nr:DUF2939 domain-containing protein [Longimicrobium sp.]
MNKRILIVAVPALVLVAAGGGWTYYRGTPQYSLKQAANAVREHDREAFQKYVAVDSVVAGTVDELVARGMEEARKEAEGQEGFAALGAELAGTLVQGLKPMLVSELRDGILKGVEKGDLRQAFAEKEGEDGPGSALAGGGGVDGVEFAGLEIVSREGNTVRADLRLHRPDLDESFPLRLRMARRDGYWQVVAVENVIKFGQDVEAVENRKLAEVNRPVLQELAGHVRLEGLRGSHETDSWGFEERVRFRARVTNVGREPLRDLRVEAGEGDDRIVLAPEAGGTVQPGQTVEVTSTRLRYSSSNPIHAAARGKQDQPLDAPLRLAGAKVGDRTLQTYTEWAQYRDRDKPRE